MPAPQTLSLYAEAKRGSPFGDFAWPETAQLISTDRDMATYRYSDRDFTVRIPPPDWPLEIGGFVKYNLPPQWTNEGVGEGEGYSSQGWLPQVIDPVGIYRVKPGNKYAGEILFPLTGNPAMTGFPIASARDFNRYLLRDRFAYVAMEDEALREIQWWEQHTESDLSSGIKGVLTVVGGLAAAAAGGSMLASWQAGQAAGAGAIAANAAPTATEAQVATGGKTIGGLFVSGIKGIALTAGKAGLVKVLKPGTEKKTTAGPAEPATGTFIARWWGLILVALFMGLGALFLLRKGG